MTTRRQTEANRRNARASTGPATEAGKAASSVNALRHGLTATRAVVLPDEDGEAFEALRRELMADLAPEGALQCQLADRACVLMWCLSRAARQETELFTYWDLLAQRNEMEAAAAHHEGVPPHLLALAQDESEDRTNGLPWPCRSTWRSRGMRPWRGRCTRTGRRRGALIVCRVTRAGCSGR